MNLIGSPTYDRSPIFYYPDYILPHIQTAKRKINLDGDLVKVYSLRLRTFKHKGLACVTCGIVGSFFVKERNHKGKSCNGSFHLNLYALTNDNEEVLMTKDHIIPKSKGGRDTLSNLQTMCYDCNQEKADTA